MIKKTFTTIATLLVLALAPVTLNAQENDTNSSQAKIDSIYRLQQKMYSEQKNNPLYDKTYGIEANLFRLILLDNFSFSGGFSYFDKKHNAEIAFPIYYQNPKKSTDLTALTVDCHYRYFLGNTLNGFYISGFTRLAQLNGTLGYNDLFGDDTPTEKGSETKIGLGFGLGYRIFSYRGLYWGSSFSIGRYVIGKNDKFHGGFLSYDDDDEYIFDLELFKFGWAF